MRYAIRSFILEGKIYNMGDIVPENVKDEMTALKNTRKDEPSPPPSEPAPRKKRAATSVVQSPPPVVVRQRRRYRPRKPRVFA